MNLSEFSNEVAAAKQDFADTMDRIFREVNEAVDQAHAACQERLFRAKSSLFGDEIAVDEPTESTEVRHVR